MLMAIAVVILLMLQWRLWVGEHSLAQLTSLKKELVEQEIRIQILQEQNQELTALIKDLKSDQQALEELARLKLGLIKQDEQFYFMP